MISTTSKSPRDVLVTAWQFGKRKLPLYTHVNSPKKFTGAAVVCLPGAKELFQTDYRGMVWQLLDSPALAEAIELASVPHFTTLQKAARRLFGSRRAQRLLDTTVAEQRGRRKRVQEAAIDSTGLGATCASPYFVQRRAARESPWKTVVYHRYPKLGLVTDVESHLILALNAPWSAAGCR